MTCQRCGTVNAHESQFCNNCGNAIQTAVVPQGVQQPEVINPNTAVAHPPVQQPAYPTPSHAAPQPSQVTIINQQGGSPAAAPAFMPGAADKSPGLALVLSFFFVGVGQLYNGEIGKGILMFFGCVILWVVLLGWIINIWSMVDAYKVAQRKQLQWQLMMSGQANPGQQVARVGH